jgi:hypothetical protein
MNQTKNKISDYTHSNPEFQQLMKEGHDYADFYGYKSSTNHNDTVDAFRHTYSHAYIAYKNGELASKLIGDSYELLGQNSSEEKVMDYYNNQVGREIGEKLAKNIDNMKFKTETEVKQYLAFEVNKAVQNKEVITSLKDKKVESTLKNMPDHPLRIYTREDIDKMTTKEFQTNEKAIMKQMREKGIPTKEQVKAKSKSNSGSGSKSSNSSSSSDENWVTINGNHVLLND